MLANISVSSPTGVVLLREFWQEIPMKIGVFDSGVGGLTVLDALLSEFPAADFVYLGDTANVPYGTKSPALIEKLCAQGAETLRGEGVEFVVVACNTASSWALPAMQKVLGEVPVLGVVDPGAQAAVDALTRMGSNAEVCVFATRATVSSGIYGRTIRMLAPQTQVTEKACPLLVPLIEEGWVNHPILHATLNEYLASVSKDAPGVALLGCTHYPWIAEAFAQALPGWSIVDSAHTVARAARSHSVLWVEPRTPRADRKVKWIFTDPDVVPAFARQWMARF